MLKLVDMSFTSYELIQWQGLQIPCTNLFKGEEKYIEVLKKQLNLYHL